MASFKSYVYLTLDSISVMSQLVLIGAWEGFMKDSFGIYTHDLILS